LLYPFTRKTSCPYGKATELAAISRCQFADLVGRRGIPRHYGADELAEDLGYGRGE
jgi:predicted HTH domain antitoxin